MRHKLLTQAAIAAFIFVAGISPAAQHGKSAHSTAMTRGEVRKVDKDAGRITINHEPLENLNMPAMTMVFRVKEPAMLDQVKAGDKVKFQAEKIGGAFTLTKIEQAH
jgi:Cu(I)/Ag(I) efflux system protein CusF